MLFFCCEPKMKRISETPCFYLFLGLAFKAARSQTSKTKGSPKKDATQNQPPDALFLAKGQGKPTQEAKGIISPLAFDEPNCAKQFAVRMAVTATRRAMEVRKKQNW